MYQCSLENAHAIAEWMTTTSELHHLCKLGTRFIMVVLLRILYDA